MYTGQGRVDAIHVNYQGDVLHVDIEGIAPAPKTGITHQEMEANLQKITDVFQKFLKQKLNTNVIVEVDIIPVNRVYARSGDDHLDPSGFIEPEKQEPEKQEPEKQNNESGSKD